MSAMCGKLIKVSWESPLWSSFCLYLTSPGKANYASAKTSDPWNEGGNDLIQGSYSVITEVTFNRQTKRFQEKADLIISILLLQCKYRYRTTSIANIPHSIWLFQVSSWFRPCQRSIRLFSVGSEKQSPLCAFSII